MNKQEVKKIMAIIAVEFGGRFEITPERVALWEKQLGRAPYADAEKAVIDLLGEPSKFPPHVGEVVMRTRFHNRKRIREATEKRGKLLELPMPHGMEEENRQKCLGLLRDCVDAIKRKMGGS